MKQKKTNCIWWAIILLLISAILVGCAISKQDAFKDEMESNVITNVTPTDVSALPSATPVLSAMPTVTVFYTPTPEASATPSSTFTVTPSNTPTATSTPMSTFTPLPIIPPQQRGQVYNELMQNNGGCTLPCWWGFKVGETSIDTVRQFYASFETFITEQKGIDGRSALYATFVDPQIERGEQVRHLFRVQDGFFIEAEIQLKNRPEYQINPILGRLGQPSEVWMWTIPEPREGILPADFLLYFPEQGALVGYRTGALKVEDAVNVCFDGRGGATIRLWEPSVWNPNGDKGFIERANDSSELTIEGHRPIEEVSNWDTEQFYTVLTDPARSECLETPSNLWAAP